MRILEKDLLDSEHILVKTFFNAISDSKFINVVKHMSLGIGYGSNDTVCTFPDDLDPGDEIFDGVEFSLINEAVIVDYRTFYHYLKLACKVYVRDFPKDEDTIKGYLDKIADKYNLIDLEAE